MRRCAARKNSSGGIIEIVVNASTPAVSELCSLEYCATPSGNVQWFGSVSTSRGRM